MEGNVSKCTPNYMASQNMLIITAVKILEKGKVVVPVLN
jgi:hypothetical protein